MEPPRNHNLILLTYLPPPMLRYGLFIQLKEHIDLARAKSEAPTYKLEFII